MYTVLLSKCLILFIIEVTSSTDQLTVKLSECITPTEYLTTLSLDLKNNSLYVQSKTLLKTCITDSILIHKIRCEKYFDVIQFSFNHSPLYSKKLTPREGQQMYHMSIDKGKIKRLDYEIDLPPDVYVMTANFHCPLDCKDCFSIFSYINDNNEEKKVLISHDRNSGIAWIFPFWSHRTNKMKFRLTLEHHKDYKAVSHITRRNISEDTHVYGENIITAFDTTPEMLINQVAIALVPQEFIKLHRHDTFADRTSLLCRPEIRKHITYALSILEEFTHEPRCLFLKEVFSECLNITNYFQSRNLPEVQYVAVPAYDREVIATPGLVFLRESDITYDEQLMLPMREIQVQLTAASGALYHMLVEQFNVNQREYSWYHETLLKYLAFTILYQMNVNKVSNTQLMNTYIVQNQWELLYLEALNTNPLLDDISTATFSFLDKIAAFRALRMVDLSKFETLSGDVIIYSRILRKIFESGINTVNVWNIMDNIIDEIVTNQYSTILNVSIPVDDGSNYPVDKWITHDYFVLEVKRDYTTGSAEVKIANCSSHTIDNHCNTWYIPVMFIIESVDQPGMFWIKPNRSNYSGNFPVTDYLIVNVQQTAYFRVNYDLENWKKIARYLNSTSKHKDPVTCAQILDDAFYFLVRHGHDIDLFFEVASFLKQETDYAIWYPMMNALEYLSKYFPLDQKKNIKRKVLPILNGFLTTTLYKRDILRMKNDTLSCQLRYEVLKWACILKDVKCNDYIKDLMNWHVKDPANNKLMAGWQDWLYCRGLRIENVIYKMSPIWHILYTKDDVLTVKQLKYLTCSTHVNNIFDSLCLVKRNVYTLISHSNSSRLKLQGKKIINDFFLLLVKHSDNRKVLKLVLNYMKTEITSVYRVERPLAILTLIINNIYSWESYLVMERFIHNIQNSEVDLNLKYEENLFADLLRTKLNKRIRFPWVGHWVYDWQSQV